MKNVKQQVRDRVWQQVREHTREHVPVLVFREINEQVPQGFIEDIWGKLGGFIRNRIRGL